MTSRQQHEDNLMTCVHCGLCLPACPTYLETGSEADSPRGRIAMMRGLHEGRLEVNDPSLLHHLDLCLGCRACETACPSGVPYGSLLETVRSQTEAAHVRPPINALARRGMLDTLAQPRRMTIALRMAQVFTGGGVPRSMAGAVADRPLKSKASPPVRLPQPKSSVPLPNFIPAVGRKRARVALLTGCVMRVLYNDIHADTARVLAANGCEVLIKPNQSCCGALHLHNGLAADAKEMARQLIDSFTPFAGLDALITNSTGCGSTLKEYGALLKDDAFYATRAAEFAAKVCDINEFLDSLGWVAPLKPPAASANEVVAYHDACHLIHGQKISEPPRRLLSLLPNLTLVPLAESDICCGSAGIYNYTQPEMAHQLQQRKIDHIVETGARTVVAANPGCLAWLEAGMAERGLSIRLAHSVTLLAEGLE